MKVELLIADDRELRAAVHELIRSEVLNVARQEIATIVASAISTKLPDGEAAAKVVEQLFKEHVHQYITSVLGKSSYGQPSFIQVEARQIIREEIRAAMGRGNIV